ncbi:MAG TPA: hypothetical protein VFI31_16225 [Pirellulales bacterium]|nr:hypothetical protein [Pirellulales bacterium]
MRFWCVLVLSLVWAMQFGGGLCACLGADESSTALRREITGALGSAFPKTPADRKAQAQQLVRLYAATAHLPAADRSRLRLRLKSRLTRLADAVRKDRRQPAEDAADTRSSTIAESGTTTETTTTATRSGRGLPGGAAQDDGQALVDLIEATIAPQTWEVNGGQGTIRYWPAWHVLVVRQTDDVHEQIGGVVHGLRQ